MPMRGMPPAGAVTAQNGRRQVAPNPAIFNRMARRTRTTFGTIQHANGARGLILEIPTAGWLAGVNLMGEITGTTAGVVTGRFNGGGYSSTAGGVPAPLGLIQRMAIGAGPSSFFWNTDGYGAMLLQRLMYPGVVPIVGTNLAAAGWGSRQRQIGLGNTLVFNTTSGSPVFPDSVIVASQAMSYRIGLSMPLVMSQAAQAGLIPIQSTRIRPQVTLDLGGPGDICTVAADLGTLSGSYQFVMDAFEVSDPGVRPDESFAFQTRLETTPIAGTGEISVRPQFGGAYCRVLASIFNNSRQVRPADLQTTGVRLQGNYNLERIPSWQNTYDARLLRGQGSYDVPLLPDDCFIYDGLAGLGLPQLAALRDVIDTADATWLEFIYEITSGLALTNARISSYYQQLLPMGSVMKGA